MSQENSSSDLMLNLFNNLPSDVVIDILSRLSVREIVICKCVCKAWFRLVETPGFVKFHLSKSVQGLIFFQSDNWSNQYKFFEFEDEVEVEDHNLHYKLISNFDLPFPGWLYGSVDGLLFLCELSPLETKPDDLYVCNPITREYFKLDSPQEFVYDNQVVTYGFGSSRTTGQYKVVRISYDRIFNRETLNWQVTSKAECHAYSLGTGLWRSLTSSGFLEYLDHINGYFFNGNIYWLVKDSDHNINISCFDLETESFSTIPTPFLPGNGTFMNFAEVTIFVSGGCLCLCDNTSPDIVIIWSMKEYGVRDSWTWEYVIRKGIVDFSSSGVSSAVYYPIKVFKDGDILIAWKDFFLLYYSNTTETVQEVDMFRAPPEFMLDAILHTPSFLSLKSFGFENVQMIQSLCCHRVPDEED